MGKIKLTKGELKRQRDALRQYERYLPTLQLKKQQLQMEIVRQAMLLEEKKRAAAAKTKSTLAWSGLLADAGINLHRFVTPKEIITEAKNIAGVDLPGFKGIEFEAAEYDLFIMPLWVDSAIESLRELVVLRSEINTLEEEIAILRQELRITTQRVNLFEKVKIPEAADAIRRIKIYIGDQLANAVGRSKVAKRKIEALALEKVLV